MKTEFSRRSFLTAGAAVAAVAGMGLAGCTSGSGSASKSASGSAASSKAASGSSAAAKLEPIELALKTPQVPEGEFIVKANNVWMEFEDKEKPFVLSDTQKIFLYYVPLEKTMAALDCKVEKDGEAYKITYGDKSFVAGAVMMDGVPFVSTEYLTHIFTPLGFDATVRETTPGTGQIQLSLRTDRPYLVKSESAEYLYEAGEHTFNGVTVTFRKTSTSNGASGKPALVFFLHGGGGRGNENGKQVSYGADTANVILDWFTKHNQDVVLVLPQAVEGSWSYYKYAVADYIKSQVDAGAVDPTRVYMTGASAGCGGTWQAVDANPDLYAAAMAVAFYAETETGHIWNAVPYEPQYLCKVENLAKVPFQIVAGGEDINGVATNPDNLKASYEAIKAAGGEAEFEIMPGLDHGGVCKGAFKEEKFLDWVFNHTRASK